MEKEEKENSEAVKKIEVEFKRLEDDATSVSYFQGTHLAENKTPNDNV